MPEVIADTSVLQYLHQLNLLDVLPLLYGRVLIPRAVAAELDAGRELGLNVPNPAVLEWADVRDVEADGALSREESLGAGERSAIALALRFPTGLLLVDDGLARRFARDCNVRYTGTLGILLRAKTSGAIPQVAPQLAALKSLGLRLAPAVEELVLREAGEL